jgi:hypothetical protein
MSACANSPQAKGRIERAFGTLQDRMVKELRLAGISTVAAANAWLPGFIVSYNARFGGQHLNGKNLHRPLTAADNLDEILTWREVRTVTSNLTLHQWPSRRNSLCRKRRVRSRDCPAKPSALAGQRSRPPPDHKPEA